VAGTTRKLAGGLRRARKGVGTVGTHPARRRGQHGTAVDLKKEGAKYWGKKGKK